MDQRVPNMVADTASAAAIVGAFAGVLPPLAALVAIIWYAVQIFESKTVQGWLAKRRANGSPQP